MMVEKVKKMCVCVDVPVYEVVREAPRGFVRPLGVFVIPLVFSFTHTYTLPGFFSLQIWEALHKTPRGVQGFCKAPG